MGAWPPQTGGTPSRTGLDMETDNATASVGLCGVTDGTTGAVSRGPGASRPHGVGQGLPPPTCLALSRSRATGLQRFCYGFNQPESEVLTVGVWEQKYGAGTLLQRLGHQPGPSVSQCHHTRRLRLHPGVFCSLLGPTGVGRRVPVSPRDPAGLGNRGPACGRTVTVSQAEVTLSKAGGLVIRTLLYLCYSICRCLYRNKDLCSHGCHRHTRRGHPEPAVPKPHKPPLPWQPTTVRLT